MLNAHQEGSPPYFLLPHPTCSNSSLGPPGVHRGASPPAGVGEVFCSRHSSSLEFQLCSLCRLYVLRLLPLISSQTWSCLCSLQQHLHSERVSHQLRENTRLGIFTLQSQEAFTPGRAFLTDFCLAPFSLPSLNLSNTRHTQWCPLVTPTLDKKIKLKL